MRKFELIQIIWVFFHNLLIYLRFQLYSIQVCSTLSLSPINLIKDGKQSFGYSFLSALCTKIPGRFFLILHFKNYLLKYWKSELVVPFTILKNCMLHCVYPLICFNTFAFLDFSRALKMSWSMFPVLHFLPPLKLIFSSGSFINIA